MRVVDRILLVLLALVNYAVTILIVVYELIIESKYALSKILQNVIADPKIAYISSFGVAVICFVVASAFVSIVINSRRYILNNKYNTLSIPVEGGANAEITVEAICAIAKKKCLSFRFVSDCSTALRKNDAGIEMRIKVKPYADVILPAAIKDMQDELSETVKTQTGIDVKNVAVIVMPYTDKKKQ